jgi:hypothetical protein
MDRRELLKLITLATGSTLIGGQFIFSACSRDETAESTSIFSRDHIRLLDEIAETIMPRTHTPGAKDAEVAEFMARTVDNCYFEPDQNTFKAGLRDIEDRSAARYNRNFAELTADQKTEMLQGLDQEARQYQRTDGGTAHYFTMIKQLAIMGFFTSETGQTEVLRHVPIPGRYDGCYPYNEGDTAWAI